MLEALSRRVRDRRVFALLLAAVVFLWSWSLLDHGFYARDRIVDTYTYEGYGLNVRDGQLPYRDFSVEYPPGALPVFIAPTYLGREGDFNNYNTWFARLMSLCGLACLAFVALARPPRRALAFVALSPLLVGQLMLSRFDLWPTAFVAAALAALVRDRHGLAWLALGCAVAAKLFALVLLPLAVVWTLRRGGRRALARAAALFVAVEAAAFGPFLVLAAHGLWSSLWGQASRPIQIESLVASFLTSFGRPSVIISNDSLSIAGHTTLAAVTSVVEGLCLLALWVGFTRGPADEARLARYGAACVCAFIALGKVLSPQYLIWLVPLVPLVRGRRGLVAIALLAAAMIDTQYWFSLPRYDAYVNTFSYAGFVLARNLLLVATLAVLALPAPALLRRGPRPRVPGVAAGA